MVQVALADILLEGPLVCGWTFSVKYPALLAENQGRRGEDGELRFDKGDLRN